MSTPNIDHVVNRAINNASLSSLVTTMQKDGKNDLQIAQKVLGQLPRTQEQEDELVILFYLCSLEELVFSRNPDKTSPSFIGYLQVCAGVIGHPSSEEWLKLCREAKTISAVWDHFLKTNMLSAEEAKHKLAEKGAMIQLEPERFERFLALPFTTPFQAAFGLLMDKDQ